MLKLTSISKQYRQLKVLNDVSMNIGDGIKVLIGINGCGKTTLLKIITGILKPDKDSINLKDKNITDFPPEDRRVGYVPQRTALF